MSQVTATITYPAKYARKKKVKNELFDLCSAYGIEDPSYYSGKRAGFTVHQWPCTLDNRILAERFLQDFYFTLVTHVLEQSSIRYQFNVDECLISIYIDGDSDNFEIPGSWKAQVIAKLLWQKYESQNGAMDADQFMRTCMTEGGIDKAFFEEGLSDASTPNEYI